MYMHKFVHVHAHFNFALLRKFYGVFSTYKNKSFVKHAATCRSLSHLLFDQPPIPNRRCRHRRATAKLPPTSRCRAAATAAATALLPPRCHCRAVRRRHRRCRCLQTIGKLRRAVSLPRCRHRHAAAKLLPTSQCRAAATAAATALLLRRLLVGCCVVIALPPPPRRRQAAADVALSRCRHRLAAAKLPTTSRCRAAAAAAPPFVGWLLLCCPSSDFVVIAKKRFL
jgi:hypothetical protein